MSLFKRTAAQVEELEAAHTALADSTQPVQKRKNELTSIQTKLAELQPAVQKFVVKADQGEKDPNKRVYGPSMVVKIRELSAKLAALSENVTCTAATVDVQFSEYEKELEVQREKQRAEEELLRKEEQKRIEQQRIEDERQAKILEEQRRKEEQMRIEKEKAEREAASKRAQQEAEHEEQQRKAREKEEAEQKEREKQQLREKQAAEETKREEQQRKQAEEASKGISLTVKTTRGKSMPLHNVPPTCHVHELKELIEKAHGVPKIAQRLIFQGRLLSDAKTIDMFNVKDGCAIHLVENSRASATTSASAVATPAVPKPIVPPGTVCHLANGKQQFDSILQNCANHRLVVVDWSAPWCGPCRMIAPAFERLATRFSDVTFVKVDTEATPANAELASLSGISAYPTFHYYINSRCVHSFSGANATNIESGVRTYRTQVSPSTTASASTGSRSSAGPSPPGQLTRNVFRALTTLKQNCSQQDFIVAVRTLLTFVRNVVNNPGQGKYRKVRTGNSTFQTRLASKPGGTDAMLAFGFQSVQENGEPFLILSEEAAANPELSTINTQLEQALAAAGGAAAPTPPSSQPRTAPAPSPGTGSANNMGFNPLAGMMGGGVPPGLANMMGDEATQSLVTQMLADPNFMQIAQEITADPAAMQRLAEAHSAMTNGDFAAMQRLQNDPALMRLQAAMASNPTVMNEAMRQLATGMGNAFPGAHMPPMPGAGTPGFNAPPQPNQAQTPSNPPPPAYPGAPTTAEEEERLLQEAIRLSMQDAGTDSNQKSEEKNEEPDPSK
eukprot:TRINITY_DN325_c0_g1_i1.p1 TRINITY_DN325_c0_g1~~TRINITY_DN325_c0_g1_i1.p1  ORF type:complete len:787 (+),score=161.72 TRINITY_DN325_c0_g1_i1:72-2432(+)